MNDRIRQLEHENEDLRKNVKGYVFDDTYDYNEKTKKQKLLEGLRQYMAMNIVVKQLKDD